MTKRFVAIVSLAVCMFFLATSNIGSAKTSYSSSRSNSFSSKPPTTPSRVTPPANKSRETPHRSFGAKDRAVVTPPTRVNRDNLPARSFGTSRDTRVPQHPLAIDRGNNTTFDAGAQRQKQVEDSRSRFQGKPTAVVPPIHQPNLGTASPPAQQRGKATTFDAGAQDRRVREQSKQGFQQQQSRQPQPAQAASVQHAPVKPRHSAFGSNNREKQKIRSLRSQLSKEKYKNRRLREERMYSNYRHNTYVPVYAQPFSDPFGNAFFWLWLMDRPSHEQATFVHNHRDDIDPKRLAALQQDNAELAQRVKQLEQQGVARDPNYVPKEFEGNADLMYGDDVIEAVAKEKGGGFPWGWMLGGLAVAGAVTYGVFFHRFK